MDPELGKKVHVRDMPFSNGTVTGIYNTIYDAEEAGEIKDHADWLDQQEYDYSLSDNAQPWVSISFVKIKNASGVMIDGGAGLYRLSRVEKGWSMASPN